MFEIIAFDADDTLWHSEDQYAEVQDRFGQLMARYCDSEAALRALHDAELTNLTLYGYGTKAFMLSMIETAISLSRQRVSAREIELLIDMGKEMLASEVRLLSHADETLAKLADDYPLMLITKGDLAHQESELARSGLAGYFRYVEIVGEKTEDTYAAILARHGIAPGRFLMVGNSLRSDVVPVLAVGGWAVHIPYEILWTHEHGEVSETLRSRFRQAAHLGELPGLVASLSAGAARP